MPEARRWPGCWPRWWSGGPPTGSTITSKSIHGIDYGCLKNVCGSASFLIPHCRSWNAAYYIRMKIYLTDGANLLRWIVRTKKIWHLDTFLFIFMVISLHINFFEILNWKKILCFINWYTSLEAPGVPLQVQLHAPGGAPGRREDGVPHRQHIPLNIRWVCLVRFFNILNDTNNSC